jgi:hypothetical protein
MERYFMSRTSAVGLLVDTRQALAANLHEKPPQEAERNQQMLQEVERLLLDVRVGRTREFELVFPSRMHVIVSD